MNNELTNNNPAPAPSIYRSKNNRVILGFCGGLAHKFNLPAGLVRFAVFLSMFFFIGWLYFGGLFVPSIETK